jgi:HYDIN/CFA65/VesB family protein
MRTPNLSGFRAQAPAVRLSHRPFGSIALASFIFLGWSSPGLAQQPLPNRLDIKAGAISIRYPANWSNPPKRFANMDELVNVPPESQDAVEVTARIQITVVPRTDHAEAIRELREIASENTTRPTFARIGGWPALQRRHLGVREQPGEGPEFADKMVLTITTAIAAGNLLIRIEASLPSAASQALIAQVEAIERSVGFANQGNTPRTNREILDLRRRATPQSSKLTVISFVNPTSLTAAAANSPVKPVLPLAGAGTAANAPTWAFQDPPLARLFTGGNGELEVAASANGRNIVVARQFLFRSSTNGGQTFTAAASMPFTNSDGDPSLADAQSGNFYMAGLGCFDSNTPPAVRCIPFARSTNTGQTFAFLTNSVNCLTGVNACSPDQEHIAADRVNAAVGGDQIYVTWRNFISKTQNPGIVCSQDNGANWTAPITVENPGLVPRITVGQDGFVYVIYRASFPNGNIRIHKFSSCSAGLTPQLGFPVTVAAVTDVTCPVPGLDRCNLGGNILSSHTAAVDDTNANHVYAAYAVNTAAGNENVVVRDSTDGGQTWPAGRVVTINGAATGRRFMPWVTTNGGEAFVAWYDRRAATPAANDLTEYFGGRARLDTLGNLTAGPEFKISQVIDPQCASWPSAPRSPNDSESCSAQPQLAGVCSGTGARCDFSAGCPGGQTCNTGGGNPPKYGDYNGNAAGAGRFFTAFASAKSPPGIAPPSAAIDVFFTTFLLGNVPQIQVPAGVAFGSVCAGSIGRATLNICNTGNAGLSVSGISSSNPRFAVVAPSGGFPVVISAGSCFPFEVTFTPAGVGPQTATLTISSDDPSTPSVTVQATAQSASGSLGVSPNLTFAPTVIQSLGPCQSTKPFVVSNTGTCDLTITNITIGGANPGDYSLSGLPAFPITLQPGHIVGAGDLNVVFAPAALARERTANISVTFVSDPAIGTTSTQTRELCGEGAHTGARVLVTQGGVPMPQAHEIELKRVRGGFLGFDKEVDEVKNAPLQTVTPTPGTACAPLQFHREYGAVTNPTQLRPGVYQLKVEAKIAGKEVRKKIFFNVTTCGFNGTIVVDF